MSWPCPFELVNDGDLLLLIERILHLRGLDTARITKVKGHADEGMILDTVGFVRWTGWVMTLLMRLLTFGRRRVSPAVIDARRYLSGVCSRWYPFILDLHRFFFYCCTARAVVNHDDLRWYCS